MRNHLMVLATKALIALMPHLRRRRMISQFTDFWDKTMRGVKKIGAPIGDTDLPAGAACGA
jgi:hypothetical protein